MNDNGRVEGYSFEEGRAMMQGQPGTSSNSNSNSKGVSNVTSNSVPTYSTSDSAYVLTPYELIPYDGANQS